MNKKQKIQALTDIMSRFTAYVGKHLPDDVMQKLTELRKREKVPIARTIYDAMFQNQKLADKLNRPCCQDTGAIQFFVAAGSRFPLLGELRQIFTDAVKIATVKAPLRHNAVETFVEKNTGNNTGTRLPWVDWEIVAREATATINVYMAGGGCTLPGTAKVLMPGEGYEGVVKFIFDAMTSYGVNACPPLLIGAGIATSVETAALLSKRALMRPIGSSSANPQAAEMERLLERGLNELGIGPQGLTGSSSVMGVHIESSARHPSAIGVGLSVGCWAHRRGTILVKGDMSYKILTHKGAKI